MGPDDRARVLDVLRRGRELGFLGPGGVEAHLAHTEAFAAAATTQPDLALDLGSGSGVAGLALAAGWPGSRWVLLDASERRTSFLAAAVAELGLDGRVEVRRDRAELAGHDPSLRGRFDVVVARSFGAPAVTAECGAPFLRVGGELVVSDPPPPQPADRWPAERLELVGLRLGTHLEQPASIQVLVQDQRCPARYPRRPGIPSKRPLW